MNANAPRAALLASVAYATTPPPGADQAAARRTRRTPPREPAADPLLPAADAAPETGRALSTFWRDVKRGILPAPYYVTPKAPRWRRSELRAAVDAAPRVRSIG